MHALYEAKRARERLSRNSRRASRTSRHDQPPTDEEHSARATLSSHATSSTRVSHVVGGGDDTDWRPLGVSPSKQLSPGSRRDDPREVERRAAELERVAMLHHLPRASEVRLQHFSADTALHSSRLDSASGFEDGGEYYDDDDEEEEDIYSPFQRDIGHLNSGLRRRGRRHSDPALQERIKKGLRVKGKRKKRGRSKSKRSRRSSSRHGDSGDESSSSSSSSEDDDMLYRGVRGLYRLHRPEAKKSRGSWGSLFWRFALVVLLVSSTTAQIALLANYDFVFVRAAYDTWNAILYPPGLAPSDNVDHVTEMHKRTQVEETVKRMVYAYYVTLTNHSVDYYWYHFEPGTEDPSGLTGTPKPIEMSVRYGKYSTVVGGDAHLPAFPPGTQHYLLHNATDYGPMNYLHTGNAELRDRFFTGLRGIRIRTSVRSFDLTYRRFCLDWGIDYEIEVKNAVAGVAAYTVDFCPGLRSNYVPSAILIAYICTCVLSGVSLLLLLSSLMRAGVRLLRRFLLGPPTYASEHGTYERLGINSGSSSPDVMSSHKSKRKHRKHKRKHKHKSRRRKRAGPTDLFAKLHLGTPKKFGFWWVVVFVCDVCNLVGGTLSLQRRISYDSVLSNDSVHFFVALGCLLAWIRLIPPAQSLGPKYSAMLSTLRTSTPFILRFMLGTMPVFLAFGMFATAAFATQTRVFRDVGMSSQSLFAIMTGDMIEDSFNDLSRQHGWVGDVFLYSFIILFICVVTKIALAGVEFFYFLSVPAAKVIDYEQEIHTHNAQTLKRLRHAVRKQVEFDNSRFGLTMLRPPGGVTQRATFQTLVNELREEDDEFGVRFIDAVKETFDRAHSEKIQAGARRLPHLDEFRVRLHHPKEMCSLGDDCVACLIRRIYRDALDSMGEELKEVLRSSSEIREASVRNVF